MADWTFKVQQLSNSLPLCVCRRGVVSLPGWLSLCVAVCHSVYVGRGGREGRETETERHREISVHLGMFDESEILVCLSSYAPTHTHNE